MKKYFLKDTNEEVTIGDIISYEDSSPFSREYTEFTLTQNILNHLKKEGVIIEKEVNDFSIVKNQMKEYLKEQLKKDNNNCIKENHVNNTEYNKLDNLYEKLNMLEAKMKDVISILNEYFPILNICGKTCPLSMITLAH